MSGFIMAGSDVIKRLKKLQVHAPQSIGVRVGPFTVSASEPGKVWIQHADGEGMQTTEAKLAAVLEKFWREEF